LKWRASKRAISYSTSSGRMVRRIGGMRCVLRWHVGNSRSMNVIRAIVFKLLSALLFAMMAVLVRHVGETFPVGQIVFFRSAFAIVPVVIIYAYRRELEAAIRTTRPLRHVWRGLTALGSMFCNFSALARLPVVDATAISYLAPLLTVAMSAVFLKERVRFFRWSAVLIGFAGVMVMLVPQLHLAQSTAAATGAIGAAFGLVATVFTAASTIQTRALTHTETTSSIVIYFSVICAMGGLVTLPFGWIAPDALQFAALVGTGLCGGLAHIFVTESYRLAPASLVAPFDYTSMLWALVLGFFIFGEIPSGYVFAGAGIITVAGLLVIWRERHLGLQRARARQSPSTKL
jgi:drug/metabolite transporter (DMT)-like permease